MLQNARVTAFTVSEVLRENQQEGKITPLKKKNTHTPRLGLKALTKNNKKLQVLQ